MKQRFLFIIFASIISFGLIFAVFSAAALAADRSSEPQSAATQQGATPLVQLNSPANLPIAGSDIPSGLQNSPPAKPQSIPLGVPRVSLLEQAKAVSRSANNPAVPKRAYGAPVSENRSSAGATGGFGIQAVLPGVTVDLVLEVLSGRVNPGDMVIVTRQADGAYGAALADGEGFFWTDLFAGDGSGVPVDVAGGDVLEVYVNGSLETTLVPQDMSGGIDVLGDSVFGAIDGDSGGTPVTITFGLWGVMADEVYPAIVASTEADGSFEELAGFDLGAENMAAVVYPVPGGWTRSHLMPDPPVFLAQLNQVIAGYAARDSQVEATVYSEYPNEIRWQGTTNAKFPFGFYQFDGAELQPGDWVEVELEDGTILDTLVEALHDISFDTGLDEVYGFAPDGETVRVSFRDVSAGIESYVEAHSVAAPGGQFTAAFPGADLRPSTGVGLFIADADGNETAMISGPPYVEAILDPRSDRDCVIGRVDGPNLPITLSIETDSGTYTRTRPIGPSDAGNQVGGLQWCYLIWGNDWGPVNFAPGDIVHLQSPTWEGQLTIADLAWEADNAANRVTGTAPTGDVVVNLSQWNASQYPINGGAAVRTTSDGGFSADFNGFDLRDGEGGVEIFHYDPETGFANHLADATRFIQAEPPNGVYGFTPVADEPVTAWLYDENHNLLASTSRDDDGDPYRFWLGDYQGYSLLPGYWVTVTAQSGWTAGVQIPELTLLSDPETDMVWGEAPKSLLYLGGGREDSGFSFFTPVDGYALNTSWLGHDLQWGDNLDANYMALNGDRVHRYSRVSELQRVEFWLEQNGNSSMWGQAQDGLSVVITTPRGQFTTWADPACGGCWNASTGELFPGDEVTVVAGPGLLPVVVSIPDPLSAQADAGTDQVWGAIGGWISRTVEVHGQWPDGYREVQTDLQGNYVASYDDIPRAGQGYVRLVDQVNFADVIYHRPFLEPSLLVNANYGHDWVEGNYEEGHTIWVTVTDSAGGVKATASGVSGPIPWWGGQSGFSTNYNLTWDPQQPDMHEDDWVYAAADNGQTTSLRLGGIYGYPDVDSDIVSGNVYASWFTDPLNGDCAVWVENGPGISFTVDPDGGRYACDFGSLGWDLLPGQNVGVSYVEPDGDRVWNVFRAPAPQLHIWTWGQGRPGAGGNTVLWVSYQNSGDAPSEQTYISATLEGGWTYLGDTSGFPHTGDGTPGNPLVWQLGDLPASQFQRRFEVFVHVDAPEGQTVKDIVQIDSLMPYYQDNPGDKRSQWEDQVVAYTTNLSMGKWSWTGDPLPGSSYVYVLNVCNQDQAGTLPVTLTDTLPVSITLQDWWGQNLGWEEVSSSEHELVLTRPSIPGYWCGEVYLRVRLVEDVWPGVLISNTAAITTSQDIDPWNNTATHWIKVGSPHDNLALWKDWVQGQFVPGGEISYAFSYGNNGNQPVENVLVTNTLPEHTSFLRAWKWTPYGEVPITPTLIAPGYLVWDIGELENGFSQNINLALRIDGDAPAGSQLVHRVEIKRLPLEDRYDDNQIVWVDPLNEYGPNLWVNKQNYRWEWEGRLNYEIRVENRGTTTLDDVWITDTYPVSTTLSKWWVNHGPWITATENPDDRQILFWLDGLNPGETASIGINLELDEEIIGQEGLAFTNQLDAPLDEDVYPADNYDQVTAYTGPDVYVEKWIEQGTPEPGEQLTLRVRFGNSNQWPWDGDPNYGSHITETLPEGMAFITATAPWDPSQPWIPDLIDGNKIVWGWGPMWNNSIWEFNLVVELDNDLQGGDVLTNTIEAFGDSPEDIEPNWENNVFHLPITVLAPRFEVAKTVEGNPVAGMPVTYNLSLTNVGTLPATNVALVDALPDGLTFGDSDGSYAAGEVTWNISAIDTGGQASGWLSGTLTCLAGVEVVNEAYYVASSDQGVTAPSGPPVSVTTVEPDIQAGFEASSVEVQTGQAVDFTSTSATDGTALTLEWDFGDGETAAGSQASHAFMQAGSYEVVLTATDACGFSSSQTVTILVGSRGVYLPLVFNQQAP